MFDDPTKKLLAYFDALKDRRSTFESQFQQIADYSLGRRDFVTKRTPGQQRMQIMYDSTARESCNLLTAALHALLTNPATNWIDARWETEELNMDGEAIEVLSYEKREVQRAFKNPEGGFSTQISEVYDDMNGFGTGCLFVEDQPGAGPVFMARPLSEIYIDVNFSGHVVAVFREFTMKAWQAIDKFGENKLPKVAQKAQQYPNAEVTFVHHVRRRALPLPGRMDAMGMPWESIYISMEEQDQIQKGGYWEFPYMVVRYKVDSGEIYGRGPGNDTLPESKMLSAIWRTFIRNAEKAADPPLLVEHDSVLPGTKLRVTPSARISYQSNGSNQLPIQYLESRAQLQWPEAMIETRSRKIERAFHSEIIQAFQDPRMSATQVIELARLSQRVLSPLLGRMEPDLLHPMITRVHGIKSRSADWRPRPEWLRGEKIIWEYVSPVARAQKAGEAQAIMDTFAAGAAIAEVDPDVLHIMDARESYRAIAEANGVPVKLMRSREQVQAILEAERQRAREMEQAEQMNEAGQTIAKLLPGVAKMREQNERVA